LPESFTSSCPPLLSSLCLVFCRYPPSEQALILFNSGISTLFVALGLKFNSSTCVEILPFSNSEIVPTPSTNRFLCIDIAEKSPQQQNAILLPTIQESSCTKSQAQENPILLPTIQESSCAKVPSTRQCNSSANNSGTIMSQVPSTRECNFLATIQESCGKSKAQENAILSGIMCQIPST